MKLTPAEYIAFMLGGYREAGRLLGRHNSVVSHWKTAKGREGQIPSGYHKTILEMAKKKKLDITAHDLIYGRDVKPQK